MLFVDAKVNNGMCEGNKHQRVEGCYPKEMSAIGDRIQDISQTEKKSRVVYVSLIMFITQVFIIGCTVETLV